MKRLKVHRIVNLKAHKRRCKRDERRRVVTLVAAGERAEAAA